MEQEVTLRSIERTDVAVTGLMRCCSYQWIYTKAWNEVRHEAELAFAFLKASNGTPRPWYSLCSLASGRDLAVCLCSHCCSQIAGTDPK